MSTGKLLLLFALAFCTAAALANKARADYGLCGPYYSCAYGDPWGGGRYSGPFRTDSAPLTGGGY